MILLSGFVGLILGVVFAVLMYRSRVANAEKLLSSAEAARQRLEVELAAKAVLPERVKELEAKIGQHVQTITDLEIEKASLATRIEERESAVAQEREQLRNLKGEFRAQFAELSAEALKTNGQAFLMTAKEILSIQQNDAEADLSQRKAEIENLVQPLQKSVEAVGDAARQMEQNRLTAFATIEQQLLASVSQVAEVSRQTSALKDALKKPHVRGRWGEVQLRNCIDLAGMEEHCDVTFQESSVTLEGELIRPDMIVRMPGGRRLAVDAKTPMEGFLEYVEANTDEERFAALTRHGRAVRNHVTNLTRSNYMGRLAASPDFVVMFLPNESFLAMALEKEPGLIEDALAKRILITTPGTLIGLLKVVRYGWNEQKLAENAQKIADEGAKLNTQITYFLEAFTKVGSSLESASEAYGDSRRRLENQIARSSAVLSELGARSKRLPKGKAAELLGAADADGTVDAIHALEASLDDSDETLIPSLED